MNPLLLELLSGRFGPWSPLGMPNFQPGELLAAARDTARKQAEQNAGLSLGAPTRPTWLAQATPATSPAIAAQSDMPPIPQPRPPSPAERFANAFGDHPAPTEDGWRRGRPRAITLSQDDIDALARMAQAETRSIEATDQREGGARAVVDTALNRFGSGKRRPRTLQKILDENNGEYAQFSPVADTPDWTWRELKPARDDYRRLVTSWVMSRAAGRPSSIEGDTHYFNPTFSDPVWGRPIKEHPDFVFGSPPFWHVHGTPHGERPYDAEDISLSLPVVRSFGLNNPETGAARSLLGDAYTGGPSHFAAGRMSDSPEANAALRSRLYNYRSQYDGAANAPSQPGTPPLPGVLQSPDDEEPNPLLEWFRSLWR